jgi:hypothetical protein
VGRRGTGGLTAGAALDDLVSVDSRRGECHTRMRRAEELTHVASVQSIISRAIGRTNAIWLVALVVSALAGCGQGDASSAPSDDELAVRDEAVAHVQEQIGEASCATTGADATLDAATPPTPPNFVAYVASKNTAYDHPTCRNSFIVDVTNVAASTPLNATAGVASPDPFTCLFTVTLESLYENKNGTYVKVNDAVSFGTPINAGSAGWDCRCETEITAPEAGEYKVVADAFQFLGPQLLVVVSPGEY